MKARNRTCYEDQCRHLGENVQHEECEHDDDGRYKSSIAKRKVPFDHPKSQPVSSIGEFSLDCPTSASAIFAWHLKSSKAKLPSNPTCHFSRTLFILRYGPSSLHHFSLRFHSRPARCFWLIVMVLAQTCKHLRLICNFNATLLRQIINILILLEMYQTSLRF